MDQPALESDHTIRLTAAVAAYGLAVAAYRAKTGTIEACEAARKGYERVAEERAESYNLLPQLLAAAL